LGQLSSSAKRSNAKGTGGGVAFPSENASHAEAGGSGTAGGSASSLGSGVAGPAMPFLPDAQNGGLLGGSGAAGTRSNRHRRRDAQPGDGRSFCQGLGARPGWGSRNRRGAARYHLSLHQPSRKSKENLPLPSRERGTIESVLAGRR
jgi:hypothetical protein